jgi:hypothetical protein
LLWPKNKEPKGETVMYEAILFWISGILFTYGFNDKMFQDHEVSKKDKIAFALSFHLWFLWPLLLGDNIRRALDKDSIQKRGA